MRTVFKYTLKEWGSVSIDMPKGAEVLGVQVQHGDAQLWALVDTSAELVTRQFRIYGTGHPIEGSKYLRFVGTFQMHDGQLVFHVFEKVG